MKHTFQSEITEKLYKNWENNYPFEKEMFQPGTYIKSITLGECEAAFEAGFIEGFKHGKSLFSKAIDKETTNK